MKHEDDCPMLEPASFGTMGNKCTCSRELQHEHTMKQFQEVCNGRNCYSSKARPAHSEECKADHDACYAAARSGE